METIKLKNLKKGQFFTKKSIAYPNEKQVFIRGDYDKSAKKYCCTRFSDFCDDQMISGEKLVYTDFIF